MAPLLAKAGLDLTQLVEGNPVATIVIDARHHVTHWNRACAQLTGVPATEMIGTNTQWRAFYDEPRPILADLIIDQAVESAVATFYEGKFRPSALIDGAWEAEDFSPLSARAGAGFTLRRPPSAMLTARLSAPSKPCRMSPLGGRPRRHCATRLPFMARSLKGLQWRRW